MLDIKTILRFGSQRWYVYDSCEGFDRYKYNLILDFYTGLLWVNADKYEYSFVSRKKDNINLSFEGNRFNWRLPSFKELEYTVTDHSFPLHANTDSHSLYPKIRMKRDKVDYGYFPFWIMVPSKNIGVAILNDNPISVSDSRNDCENLTIALTDEFKKNAVLQCSLGDYIRKCGLSCTDDSELIMRLMDIYNACISLSVMCQIKVKFGISPKFQDSTCQAIFNQISAEYGDDVINKKHIFVFLY